MVVVVGVLCVVFVLTVVYGKQLATSKDRHKYETDRAKGKGDGQGTRGAEN